MSSIHYHPSGGRCEENVATIHPKPLTQITVINFAVMMEEMSANGQSSIGCRVWEPSTTAPCSVVKTGACWDPWLALGVFCPFVLELEGLTVCRSCTFWGPGPCAGPCSCCVGTLGSAGAVVETRHTAAVKGCALWEQSGWTSCKFPRSMFCRKLGLIHLKPERVACVCSPGYRLGRKKTFSWWKM